MRNLLEHSLLRPAFWLAQAYFGYWIVVALARIAVPTLILPMARAPVAGWQLEPFRAMITNFPGTHQHLESLLRAGIPLLLLAALLAGLTLTKDGAPDRRRPAALDFAGLFAAVQLAGAALAFAVWGWGPLAEAAAASGAERTLATWLRIPLALTMGFGLLASLRRVGKSLSRGVATFWPSVRPRSAGLAAIGVPLVLMSFAGTHFPFGAMRLSWRMSLYTLVPLLLVLIAALWGEKGALRAAPSLATNGELWSIAGAVALLCALSGSAHLREWMEQARLAHLTTEHYEIFYDANQFARPKIERFGKEREAALAALAGRLGIPVGDLQVRVVLYPGFEAKKLATGDEHAFTVEGTTIEAVLGGPIETLDTTADASALLAAGWGRAGSKLMGEWVARWLAGTWQGCSIRQAAEEIENDSPQYTLAQLLSPDSDGWLSPLAREPLGAAWVGTVAEQAGWPAVRRLYADSDSERSLNGVAQILGKSPDRVEQNWEQGASNPASDAPCSPPTRAPLPPNFYFRGISFSHEGWNRSVGGYSSPTATTQLEKLQGMGVNAVALVPYGFVRGARNATITYTGTDESDEELMAAAWEAHRLGMRVMLKPQLWVSGGTFTGELQFSDPALRAKWMQGYREFILHYARFAQWQGIDLLSVGNELEGMTTDTGAWRTLIAEVRKVYHGPLTYAANWGREAETLGFWDALDYVGVNNYYPLENSPTSDPQALLAGARRVAARLEAVSRRAGRPVVFTEIGYPSLQTGAVEPWIEDGGRAIDLEQQATAYDAALREFSSQAWLRGMFWWKWPSDGRGGGSKDGSYTPLDKPAEQVLGRWYLQWEAQPKQPAAGSQ